MKGHSERIPGKNLKLFSGKPLYHAIITSLINSDFISKIAVNTDSEEVKRDIKRNFSNDIIIIDRPKNIRGDFVSMNKIIEYDLSIIKSYDYFLQTHSTNPLLSSKTIDEAIEFYFKNIENYDSIFSVTQFKSRFYWGNGKPINHNTNKLIRTQDLPPIYEENSNFYIFSRSSFKKAGNKRIGMIPYMFEVKKLEAIDIDDIQDFKFAEIIYNREADKC